MRRSNSSLFGAYLLATKEHSRYSGGVRIPRTLADGIHGDIDIRQSTHTLSCIEGILHELADRSEKRLARLQVDVSAIVTHRIPQCEDALHKASGPDDPAAPRDSNKRDYNSVQQPRQLKAYSQDDPRHTLSNPANNGEVCLSKAVLRYR